MLWGTAERFGEAKTNQELHKRVEELEKENKRLKELLDRNLLNLDELTIQDDSQEQSSTQVQIEIPPKK